MATLTTILAWLGSYAGGLVVKLLVDALSTWQAQRQADTNAKAAGAAEVTTAIHKGNADAERKADSVAVNRPGVGTVVNDMAAGKDF